jgi:hypothetical protein
MQQLRRIPRWGGTGARGDSQKKADGKGGRQSVPQSPTEVSKPAGNRLVIGRHDRPPSPALAPMSRVTTHKNASSAGAVAKIVDLT